MPKKYKKDYPIKNIMVPPETHKRVVKYGKKHNLYNHEVVTKGMDKLEQEDGQGAT